MKVAIINGCPKGILGSINKYSECIIKNDKKNEYEVLEVGKYINVLYKTKTFLDSYIKIIEDSDLIIWLTNTSFFMPSEQIIKFIDLIYENNCIKSFVGKYATSIISSYHIFDTTAEKYLNMISENFGCKYITAHTTSINSILSKKEQKKLVEFSKKINFYISNRLSIDKLYTMNQSRILKYNPVIPENKKRESSPYKILFLKEKNQNENLNLMSKYFENFFPLEFETIILETLNIKVGEEENFTYLNKETILNDDFENFYDKKFQTADCVIMCKQIKAHTITNEWKKFYDRTIYRNYMKYKKSLKTAYIISGSLSNEFVFTDFLKQKSGLLNEHIIGIASDENKSNSEITSSLQSLAKTIIFSLENGVSFDNNFYSIAGHKLIRDLIYENQYLLPTYNKFFKDNNLYDFPKIKTKTKIKFFIINLLPQKLKKKIYQAIDNKKRDKIKKLF